MSIWVDRVVPRITDRALSEPEVMELRRTACRGLRGRVLEIGFGSGLNLGAYPSAVASVDAVEPSDLGWSMSARRRADAAVPVRRIGLDVERLPADDGAYDAVLSTFTLCTIPDAARALAEVRRVLAPSGVFCFLEHGRAPEERVERWQHRLDPLQRVVCGGCHLSRDVPALVEEAGLRVDDLEQSYLPGPAMSRPWLYTFLGRASAPAA